MVDDKLIRGNQTGEAKSVPTVPKPLSEMFKPQSGSWECSQCYTRNLVDNAECLACQGPKPGQAVAVPTKSASKSSLSEMFKPATGSWECSECYVRNNSNQAVCMSCQNPNPKSSTPPSATATEALFSKPPAGFWECPGCYVRNTEGSNSCVACTAPKAGSCVTESPKPSNTLGKLT